MKKIFHIGLLLGILAMFLYAAINHSTGLHDQCNKEWQLTFLDDSLPITKAGILLMK